VNAAGCRLYVYYRIAAPAAPATAAAVRAMQARLCAAHPGLAAELLWRSPGHDAASGADLVAEPDREPDSEPDRDPGAERTLMEVYRRPGGIDPALARAIAAAAAALPGEAGRAQRHVELFAPCD
jgi:hypothetical protein